MQDKKVLTPCSIDTRSISLFSGAMGLDIGLINAGIDIKVGQDIDEYCVHTMLANGHPGILGDIRELSSKKLLEATEMSVGEPFLICGGPPCQPFSTAGKRFGINGPRGSLFLDFVRMINEIRPRFFVMENVKGLMSAFLKDENGDNTSTKVLDIILDEFRKLNYKTVYGVLDAVNYGVPQFRERLVLIGSRDNEDIFLPIPTHFRIHQNAAYRWITLSETIRDLENAESECAMFSENRLRYLRMVPEGGNWKDLPADIVQEAMGGAFTSGGGKVGFYRRLSYAQPSPTVVTSPVQKATMMCHPTKDRPLSVAEYARIQQFPDSWKLIGTTAAKYKQIGNAVPVGLAKAIGEMLISVAMGSHEIVVKRVRGTKVYEKIQEAIKAGGDEQC